MCRWKRSIRFETGQCMSINADVRHNGSVFVSVPELMIATGAGVRNVGV